MVTRYSRRVYRRGGTSRSSRAYSFPKSRYRSLRSRGTYRGYGSYYSSLLPYAARAAPYFHAGYKAYRKGGIGGLKRYAGSVALEGARSAIKAVTGYGAYRNVGRGGMQGKQVPKIRNGGLDYGTVVISNEEYIGDIKSSVTAKKFLNNWLVLNPGNSQAFPWLASIAQNFQEYRWEGLCFTFKSMSGDALTSTDTSIGTVIMATQYDPTQPTPQTKAEMENMEFANSAKPSQTFKHFVECAKNQTPLTNLYVNSPNKPQTGDPRFYNFGTFNIATVGLQGEQVNCGELWVSYQVRLYKPQLYDALGNDVQFFQALGTFAQIGCTDAKPFGTLNWAQPQNYPQFVYSGSNMAPIFTDGKGLIFAATYHPKTYFVRLATQNNSLITFNPGDWTFRNCAIMNEFNPYGPTNAPTATPLEGDTNNSACSVTFVVTTGEGNMTQPWGFEVNDGSGFNMINSTPGALGRWTFMITEIPNGTPGDYSG